MICEGSSLYIAVGIGFFLFPRLDGAWRRAPSGPCLLVGSQVEALVRPDTGWYLWVVGVPAAHSKIETHLLCTYEKDEN